MSRMRIESFLPRGAAFRLRGVKGGRRGERCDGPGGEAQEAREQRRRYRRESGAEAPPQPEDATSGRQAQDDRHRQADQPVPDHVGGEGEAGVACAAQDARPHRLDAVRDLEDGRYREERRRGRAHLGVARHEPRQLRGEEEEGEGGERHHARAGPEGHQARPARRRRVVGADRPAHPHRAGAADPDRESEGGAGERDGYLVSAERDPTEPAGEEADQREQADLGRHVERDGRAHPRRARPPPGTATAPTAAARTSAWSTVTVEVARALPAAPSGGSARSGPVQPGRSAPPKTRSRSSAKLTAFASKVDTSTARVSPSPCKYARAAAKKSRAGRLGRRIQRKRLASRATSSSMPSGRSASGARAQGSASKMPARSASQVPCHRSRRAPRSSPAPNACAMSGSSPIIRPVPPPTPTTRKRMLPSPAPASTTAPARPQTAASTRPMKAWPELASASGSASRRSERSSARREGRGITGAG